MSKDFRGASGQEQNVMSQVNVMLICDLYAFFTTVSAGFVVKNVISCWRAHTSTNDVCLEVRGEIIRTVLCCIVY